MNQDGSEELVATSSIRIEAFPDVPKVITVSLLERLHLGIISSECELVDFIQDDYLEDILFASSFHGVETGADVCYDFECKNVSRFVEPKCVVGGLDDEDFLAWMLSEQLAFRASS